ncbi:uncharacterized protein LOC112581656 isoform X3 [Bubalus bubalis]|uniref:uncharacterized protein LOC112581656 isoform X3 n=1 Tax=Bubalus bubalis TaxID=89462 RepID=UPI001E1B7B80|nr:uncharacterized protein LOC112581656 isoform X3 [Bubalus bubalis]
METRRYGTEAEGSRSLQGHVRTYGGPRAPNRAEGAWGRYCACARARVWAEGFRRSRRLRPALLGGRSHGRRWSVPDNGDKCAEAQSVLLREGRGRGEPLIARTKRLAFQEEEIRTQSRRGTTCEDAGRSLQAREEPALLTP